MLRQRRGATGVWLKPDYPRVSPLGMGLAKLGDGLNLRAMCNLYAVTKGQQAIRELTRAMHDRTGNLPPLPGIFPDYGAPIVREGADGRELSLARWGMPSPVFALKGKKTDPGVTNIRNVKSPHWRRWLGTGKPMPGAVYQLLGKRIDARRLEATDLVRVR